MASIEDQIVIIKRQVFLAMCFAAIALSLAVTAFFLARSYHSQSHSHEPANVR